MLGTDLDGPGTVQIGKSGQNKTNFMRRGYFSDSIYIAGKVQNVPVNYVLDTGAEQTVVSKNVFNKIDNAIKPNVIQKGRLLHAGGEPLNNVGKCELELYIDKFKIKKEVMLAEIKDDVLLGMDVLKGSKGEPADIILSEGKIVLDGFNIECKHYSDRFVRKVTSADHYIVQGYTEQIIDAFVEGYEMDDLRNNSDMIIEPTKAFQEKHPISMASSVVNTNKVPTVTVRLINPFPDDASIKQDTVIGVPEFITTESVVLFSQENGDPDNFASARRIEIDRQVTQSGLRQVINDKTNTVQG